MRIGAPAAHVSHAAARSAVEIDGEVEALPPQLAARASSRSAGAARPRGRSTDRSVVEVRVVAHDRRGRGFDEIGDARVREAALERANDAAS